MRLNVRQIEELIRVHTLPLNHSPKRVSDYRRDVHRETVAALKELLDLRKSSPVIPVIGEVS